MLHVLPRQIYSEGYLFNLDNIAVSLGQKSLSFILTFRN